MAALAAVHSFLKTRAGIAMAIDFDALDYDDPCALLAVYRPALARLELGEAIVRAKVGSSDEVEFRAARIEPLRARVRQLEDQCAIKQGNVRQRRRRPIRAGFRY